jgi:hypothetical protein
MAKTTMTEARRRYEDPGRHVRHFRAGQYAAETWSHERHVIIKAEHGAMIANPRFVLTTLDEFDPKLLYDVGYCARGRCLNFIKHFKNAPAGDRLSCGPYVANLFRLLLRAAAYRLLYAVRTVVTSVAPELGRVQFDTLRLRLLKVAGYVTQSVRRILLRLPRSLPFAAAFRALAAQLARPAPA